MAGMSPVHERVAIALSESPDALRAIETAPARRRAPALVLAALHDLALAGRAPALAAAYATNDDEAAAEAALDTLRETPDAVVARRPVRTPIGHAPVLRPLVAEAAHRVGATAIGLVDVGCDAGFDLTVDRVGVTYAAGSSDPASPVQQWASVVGDRPVPTRAIPDVVARIGIDLDPVDVADPDEARWLRACRPPDEDRTLLAAQIALAATTARTLLRGDAVDLLPDALDRVPGDALPVVTTTWTLSALPLERRLRFLQCLDAAATDRPVAWVSVEGVGVAPAVPTMGDRPASGHSILGLVIFTHAETHARALGRCWSRGRLLSWLVDP